MDLYHPMEYSRPTAIHAQFEIMRKEIEELKERLTKLESL